MEQIENQTPIPLPSRSTESTKSVVTLVVDPEEQKSSNNEKVFVESDDDDEYPEGSRGWLVVAGGLLIHVVIFGIQNTFGIFQEYYTNVIFSKSSPASISLIGTLGAGILAFLTSITGNLADRFGYKTTINLGAVIIAGGLVCASFCTEVWQLILTQGVIYGVGASLCYPPAISAPPQWFFKRRGLATGIAVSGSGVGGLILSPVTQALIKSLGYRWALRKVIPQTAIWKQGPRFL
ncbi:hypothetical protein K7432_014637 [Basidiobolus ranarum]|uniref:Major facilitator superfamily (MFS) profile domain-containing protein n=1 Tax=Basidiobolus ranarum TaxID=34480 RepID=A0ABR2VPC3_9FUNG